MGVRTRSARPDEDTVVGELAAELRPSFEDLARRAKERLSRGGADQESLSSDGPWTVRNSAYYVQCRMRGPPESGGSGWRPWVEIGPQGHPHRWSAPAEGEGPVDDILKSMVRDAPEEMAADLRWAVEKAVLLGASAEALRALIAQEVVEAVMSS